MKRCFFFLLLTLALAAHAQPWQWAIRGGCVNAMQVSQDYNNITHITTDQAGNVYTLGPVGSFGLKVDGRPLTAYSGFSPGASTDILLTSFTASGQYRWAKVFGGTSGDYGHSLKTDSLGYVYVSGKVQNLQANSANTQIHFDIDTVLPFGVNMDSLFKIMFLVKYDTAGNFQWLKMPEPDTVTVATQLKYNSFPYRIETESNGTVHWFCHLKPGKFNWANSNIIAQEGDYILKYNPQGEMTDRVLLDMETSGFGFFIDGNAHFARNPQNGNYYIAGTHEGGYGPLLIGGDTIKDRMYMAAFDATGQVLWKLEGTNDMSTNPQHLNNRINAMSLDDNGGIYVTGAATDGAQFGGFTMSYPKKNAGQVPFLLKFNSAGNLQWGQNAHGAASYSNGLTVSGKEVAITGEYAVGLYWPGSTDTARGVINGGNDAYLARFDKATGELATMERTRSPFGVGSYGHSIAAGPANTYYLGGNFDAQLYLGNDTLTSGGSQRSFFLAQYQCDVPQASFSFTGNNAANLLSLAYTGAPADSVVWHLGDGTVLTGDSIQHPYAAKGRYRVCATAYFPCTEVTACDSLDAGSIGVAELEGLSSVEVYPNPTTGKLYIENAGRKASFAIFNLSGQKLLDGKLEGGTAWIGLSGLPVGIYLLQLSDSKGAVIHKKLIKE